MQFVTESEKPFADLMTDLIQSVEKHGFGVLHIHDLKGTLQAKGVDFAEECRILEICNPRFASEVLGRDMMLSAALPCRISVFTDKGRTLVGTLLPTRLLGLMGQQQEPAVDKAAHQVEAAMVSMMEEAAG